MSKSRKLPDIDHADLLSAEEVEKLPKLILRHGDWWWLRSPGYGSSNAIGVHRDGSTGDGGYYVNIANLTVRPALRLTNLNDYKVGDDFKFGGKWFRVINERTALCLDDVGKHRFDSSSNNYETSEIKQYIDDWFDNFIKK